MSQTDHNTNASHFLHRWYDQDHHLSELVRALQALSAESQYLLAIMLGEIAESAIEATSKHRFIKELDWDKIVGLMKSKQGRRWYDEEPEMHRAFNLLYSLPDNVKDWVAEQVYHPVLLIQTYEERCAASDKAIDLDVLCQVIEVNFKEGTDALAERFAFIYKL